MRGKQWAPNDNSSADLKIALRLKYLPPASAVLDLFCGTGRMYHGAYRDNAHDYHGVDKQKVHDGAICTLCDNVSWVKNNDIERFNVFDLDDYGSPWALLYLILRKHKGRELTVFVTDGLPQHLHLTQYAPRWMSAIESVPRSMPLYGVLDFYPDVFLTMLKDIERRYGWKTTTAACCHNSRRSVYYWALKLHKQA